jgi:hypothetical protein
MQWQNNSLWLWAGPEPKWLGWIRPSPHFFSKNSKKNPKNFKKHFLKNCDFLKYFSTHFA